MVYDNGAGDEPGKTNRSWIVTIHSRIAHLLRDYDPNIPSEMGFAHRRRRFSLAKPVTITARRAVIVTLDLWCRETERDKRK